MFSLEYFNSLTPYVELLKDSKLPIFVWGMGDGCIKLFDVFDRYGIPCAGIFASDEFVRDKTFLGHRIHSLSEIESRIDDFIIVLAFGAGYKSLIDKIDGVAKRHKLIVPDMPVVGGGLFTKEYLRENFDSLLRVYNLLSDERSRTCFEKLIEYRITGEISCLKSCESDPSEAVGILSFGSDETYADLGAYTGDTVAEFVDAVSGKYRRICAFEPNARNFRKLKENTAHLDNVEAINAAAGDENRMITVSAGGGRMSRRADKGVQIMQLTLDSVLNGDKCSYIKYDVEGAEMSAVCGSEKTILECRPKLCIALYHRVADIFEIPLKIHELCPEYSLYIRHFPYYPAWDTNLYAVLKQPRNSIVT